jgi:hypothetical protein
MTASPLVSVLVTGHDVEHAIAATLDSAIGQEYAPERLELVVVDDGSTDGTPAIIAEYEARLPGRLRAYRQPHAGPAVALGRALVEARGDLLALLPAGATWPSGRIAAQAAALQQRPDVGLLYSTLADDDGLTLPRAGEPPSGRPVARLLRHDWIDPSSIVLRATLQASIGMVPPELTRPDRWLAARVASLAEIDYLPAPVPRGEAPADEPPGRVPTAPVRIAALRDALALQRWFLRTADGDAPGAEELSAIWGVFAETARQLLAAAGGDPFATILTVTDAERAEARRTLADAHDASNRGEAARAAALAARAAGLDPWCAPAAELLAETLAARPRRVPSDPLVGARRFVTLAFAEELFAHPELLAAYARAFDGEADATLAIDASALLPATVGQALGELVSQLGLDADGTAHLIAVLGPIDAAIRGQLPRRADALLTRTAREAIATPAFDERSIGALAELAGRASAA